MYRILIVSGAIAAAASTCNAGFTFTSQFRSIRAEASAALGAVVDERSLSASDFGLFTQSVGAEAFDPQTGARGWGSAHMDSRLEPLRVLAQGGWSGGRNGQGAGGGGSSSISVGFSLDAASEFTFSVGLVSDPFVFSGPDGFLITTPGTYSGTLQPGDYMIQASSSGRASFPPSGGGYSLDLNIVPAPAGSLVLLGLLGARGALRRRLRVI